MKNILISICARGGSKGIPKKNIRNLVNKPLIAYTIKHCFELSNRLEQEGNIVNIELSTDSDEIIEVARKFGLETKYKRPDHLATDKSGKLAVIKNLLIFSESTNKLNYDYIFDLDVSSPLRELKDLIEGFNKLKKCKEALNLYSVSKANKNPYFNMVEKNQEGFYSLSKNKEGYLSRQEAPCVYEMNASFYIYRRIFFEDEPFNLFKKSIIYEMPHICFDVDHILDFDFLEYLVLNKQIPFNI